MVGSIDERRDLSTYAPGYQLYSAPSRFITLGVARPNFFLKPIPKTGSEGERSWNWTRVRGPKSLEVTSDAPPPSGEECFATGKAANTYKCNSCISFLIHFHLGVGVNCGASTKHFTPFPF